MKNPSHTQKIHRQIITRIVHAGISTYIGSRGPVGMRHSWVHIACFVITTVLLVTSAGSVTGVQHALKLTPAEARKMIADSYRKWGKARIEFDKKTFERMLSPDFYVQLKNRSLTRQEFIDRISVQPQGADGLISTALTGEGPQLKDDEITAVWDVVFQKAKQKLSVVPAVISLTTARAVHLVSIAEEKGAAAVMVAPILNEIYVERSQSDIITYYKEIAGSTSLPIILFNYPSLTLVDIVPSLAKRLVEIENIRYIKESTGDVRRVHEIQRLTGKSLSVICGAPNTALECFALGCRTWITGILNNVPRSARQLMQAVHDLGDLGLARRIYYYQILPMVDVLQRNNNSLGTIKAGVSIRGIDVGPPRRPGRPIGKKDHERLKQLFKNFDENEAQIAEEIAKKKILK